MFAFLRDADGVRGGRHGVFRGMGDDPPLSESGDVHGREEVAGGDVRIFHDFGEALDRGDRKSFGFEEALPLRQRLLAEPGGEGLRDRGPVGFLRELALGQFRRPDELAHADPELRFDRGHGEPSALLRFVEGIEREGAGEERLARDRLLAGRKVSGQSEDHECDRGVVDREVDELAAAGAVPRPKRREDRQRGIEASREVGDRHARDRGTGIRAAPGHGQDAGEGLEIQVVAGEVLVRAGLAVSGEGAVDDAGIHHREVVVRGAEPGHDPGPELLHDHVGAAAELAQDVLAFRRLQVHRERPFPAVHHEERVGRAIDQRRDRPHVVAQCWILDLDHVRPEVREELGAKRAREEPGEIQHDEALEGSDQRARHPGAGFEPCSGESRP